MKPAEPRAGTDYDTRRTEPAALPLVGGSSDIGLQLGGVGTLTHFQDGTYPYAWKTDLVLSGSFKNSPEGGTEIAQQNYEWKWDIPGLAGGRLRLNPFVAFQRAVNAGYFGLGNESASVAPGGGAPGRYFQWIQEQGLARVFARIQETGPWAAMLGTTFRYIEPETYADSKLAADAASNQVIGVEPLLLGAIHAGGIYDSRDDEIFPTRGQFHQMGVRAVQGFPLDAAVHYGAASAILSGFVPLARECVLALRGVVDVEFGDVPFYDLYMAGPFVSYEMPGGSSGIRGVPIGRYLGPVKAVVNAELRSLFAKLRVLGQSFRLGGDAFFDTGRVWGNKTPASSSTTDETFLGLHYGVGLGGYLLWGQAAMFRVEVAYSPDAASFSSTLPLGIYVEDGTMF